MKIKYNLFVKFKIIHKGIIMPTDKELRDLKLATHERVAHSIVVIAAFFTLIAAIVYITVYINKERTNPEKNQALISESDAVRTNSEGVDERDKFLAKQANESASFWTSIAFLKRGRYMLLFCTLVTIFAIRWKASCRKKQLEDIDTVDSVKPAQNGIMIFAGVACITAVIASVILQPDTLTKEHIFTPTNGGEIVNVPPNNTTGPAIVQTPNATDTTVENNVAGKYPTMEEWNKNWPVFRGPFGTGVSLETNLPVEFDLLDGKNVLWKTKIPVGEVNSPVAWGNQIFISSAVSYDKQTVHSIDLATGEFKWQTVIPPVTDDQEELANVFRKASSASFAAPTLAVDGYRVYAKFGSGDIAALTLDGKMIWSKNYGIPDDHYGHSSSLTVYKNVLIHQFDCAQDGQRFLYGLNVDTGEVIYKVERHVDLSWSSPTIIFTPDRPELLLIADPGIVAYNPLTGEELWSAETVEGELAPAAAYTDGLVFTAMGGDGSGGLSAIRSGRTGKQFTLWNYDVEVPDTSSPVAHNGRVFIFDSLGSVTCLDAQTGDQIWHKEMDDGFYASPILADGKIYIADRVSRMFVIDAADDEGAVLNSCEVKESISATIAIIKGKLIIRSDKHLYCIGRQD